jgi:anti-sigma B factor antagonist
VIDVALEADPRPLFAITFREDEAGPVICISGEVDLAAAPPLRDSLMAAIDISQGPVTVDLAEVTFMDSTGLSVLISAHKRLDSEGRQLRLRSPSAEITRVVKLSGLDDIFHVEDGPPAGNGSRPT